MSRSTTHRGGFSPARTTPAYGAWAVVAVHSGPSTRGALMSGNRVYAELPSGAELVPGRSAGCPGPDVFGACPLPATTSERPCAGAIWCYTGERGWRFEFHGDSGVCPAVVLDPLGPLPVPLD